MILILKILIQKRHFLRDGDIVVISSKNEEITVSGAVNNPSKSFLINLIQQENMLNYLVENYQQHKENHL